MRQFTNENTDNVLAQCSKCQGFLPLSSYHKHKGRKYDIKSYCIDCGKKAWTPEHKKTVRASWEVKTNRAEKRRLEYNSVKNFEQKLKLNYKLSPEDYETILEKQNGRCAICLVNGQNVKLVVDHNHACCSGNKSCGACVRGLLCGSCNNGLGRFKDSVEALAAAQKYLTSHM